MGERTVVKTGFQVGYEKKAHFEQCGYKLGKWWDIVWMQKVIASNEETPEPFQRFTGGF